jgi:hypothetical protein
VLARAAEASSDYSAMPFSREPWGKFNFELFDNYHQAIEDIGYICDIDTNDKYGEGSVLHWLMTDPRVESISTISGYNPTHFDASLALECNQFLIARKVYFIAFTIVGDDSFSERWNALLNIHPALYAMVNQTARWLLPKKIEFKVTNPGEQMTGTFHHIVLSDLSVWYHGQYYSEE